MKKTELEKLQASKIANRMKQTHHGAGSQELDRRERRKRDQALGLVPFAVKLDGALVKRLRERAAERGGDLNGVVAELLKKGLGESG